MKFYSLENPENNPVPKEKIKEKFKEIKESLGGERQPPLTFYFEINESRKNGLEIIKWIKRSKRRRYIKPF